MSLPAWVEAGPEAGHVMDVAVQGDRLLALTRAGVRAAPLPPGRWQRDPRFPEGVQHIAASGELLWAVTERQIWQLEPGSPRSTALPEGVRVVDVEAADGALLLALRGASAGLYRLRPEQPLELLLQGPDPWRVAARGSQIALASLDQGLWRSEADGQAFRSEGMGPISAVAFGAGGLWWARPDGRILQEGEERCALAEGVPTSMVEVAGQLWAVLDSALGPLPLLARCPGELWELGPLPGDTYRPQPTELWSLGPDAALLGTFRSGPLLLGPEGPRPAREGFRATLTAAVEQRADGQLALALMSTGIFTGDGRSWTMEGSGEEDRDSPVTDVMDLRWLGEELLVLDFEGLTRGRGRAWARRAGLGLAGSGRHSALVELAEGPGGATWARDHEGGLWQEGEMGWEPCGSDILRMEGRGEELLLIRAEGGARSPACGQVGPTLLQPGELSTGAWRAGGGQAGPLGERRWELPRTGVQALAHRRAADGDELLVAMMDGSLLRCAGAACAPAAQPLSGPARAVGWLSDGRLWAAEERGSFLVAEGEQPLPALSRPDLDRPPPLVESAMGAPLQLPQLDIPPWRQVGRPMEGSEHPDVPDPGRAPRWLRHGLLLLGPLSLVGLYGALRGRRRRYQ